MWTAYILLVAKITQNFLINHVLYQIQVTGLLPFFLSILHLLWQLSKIMLLSTVKLLLAIVMSIIFGPLKTLPRSSKSCKCVTFGVLRYLLSTFLLYTPHCHMILSKQKCCLLSTGVSTESQKRTSVLQLRRGFLATRNMTRINVGLARSYVKLLLSLWKTYMCNFDGMVYQQIVGIPMGTHCAPLIADLFLYCNEKDFMSDLQKSKRFDLIDMFNDTSRYLDDIFTIDNPEFDKTYSWYISSRTSVK